jgi:hypothetical protein
LAGRPPEVDIVLSFYIPEVPGVRTLPQGHLGRQEAWVPTHFLKTSLRERTGNPQEKISKRNKVLAIRPLPFQQR